MGDTVSVTAITAPAVTAVTGKNTNECSPNGEVGGNNVDGTCAVCNTAGTGNNVNSDCTPPIAVVAVTAADAVTASWHAHCI